MALERLTMGMMRPYNSKKYTGDHTNGNFDDPYCEKVARDALTMSTDMLDMFVKKDMLACVGLVMRMKRSSYQDSPWHLVQECCQQSCCPTTTAFQWITRWNVPSPAILHSCHPAFNTSHSPSMPSRRAHDRPTWPVYLKKTRADSVEDHRSLLATRTYQVRRV